MAVGLGFWILFSMTNDPSIIAGRVLSPRGQPVAEARIYFTASPVAMPDIALLTDVSGRFSLSVPAAGSYTIGCSAEGYAPATATVKVGDKQTEVIEIRLSK